ncbi:MAG: class I SAM-dependent methyltransferase [Saprospiraceae bacterium]
MTEEEAGQHWNQNAAAWTVLTRAGYDVYRDHLNTPAFLAALPPVHGLTGLDIGCGEGNNTRLVAQRGARMHAVDISEIFIENAREYEARHPTGIAYQVASATKLPFPDACFDFATSFMCLMDIPDAGLAIREAFRVVKPGGFFQFSITHPCFDTPHRKNLRAETGLTYAIEVGDYYKNLNGRIVQEWIFGAAPDHLKAAYQKFKVPLFNQTLTQWFEAIRAAGFVLEHLYEPYPSDDVVRRYPSLQDAQVVGYFLHFRCRK